MMKTRYGLLCAADTNICLATGKVKGLIPEKNKDENKTKNLNRAILFHYFV
jgi:hypothetical protein